MAAVMTTEEVKVTLKAMITMRRTIVLQPKKKSEQIVLKHVNAIPTMINLSVTGYLVLNQKCSSGNDSDQNSWSLNFSSRKAAARADAIC